MTNYLDLILKFNSSCLHCGSLLIYRGHLCKTCLECLEFFSTSQPILLPPFCVSCLYDWSPGQSDILSSLVLSLKGQRAEAAWEFYAQKFAQAHVGEYSKYSQMILIPAPSRIKERDHAALWAAGLAKVFQTQVQPILRKKKSSHQRGADRAERALIELEVVENNTINLAAQGETLWVFVDDIVTTGATARAAHIALGQPKNFVVWALAYRRLSCGASGDLVYKTNV